jgi:hypothetical protein
MHTSAGRSASLGFWSPRAFTCPELLSQSLPQVPSPSPSPSPSDICELQVLQVLQELWVL